MFYFLSNKVSVELQLSGIKVPGQRQIVKLCVQFKQIFYGGKDLRGKFFRAKGGVNHPWARWMEMQMTRCVAYFFASM